MPPKEQLQKKQINRCKHRGDDGDFDCDMFGTRIHCTEDGKALPGASAKKMCATMGKGSGSKG